jgi:TPR repeat protein
VEAQYNLGVCYHLGKGVSKSAVQAYALFNLASVENNDAREARDQLEKGMKMEQIMEAQARTRELKAEISGERKPELLEENNCVEVKDEDLSI